MQKRSFYTILATVLILLSLISLPVRAEGDAEKTVFDGIVQVEYGYYFEDGSLDVWATAPGIVINKNTVLTYNIKNQDFSGVISERQPGYAALGIDIGTIGDAENKFMIYNEGSSLIGITEVIPCESNGNSFLILKTEEEMDETVKFTPGSALNDQDKFAVGYSSIIMDTYHYAKKENVLKQNIRIIDETEDAINFSIDSSEFYKGGAIINGQNQVYALITDTDNGGIAIPYNEIERILDENNILFDIGEEILPVDKSKLENEITLAKSALSTTTDTYTEESAKKLDKTLREVEKQMNKENITQENVDSLTQELQDARDHLEVIEKKSYLWLVIVIIVLLLFIGAFVVLWLTNKDLVYKLLGVKKKENKPVVNKPIENKPVSNFIGQDEEIPGMGDEAFKQSSPRADGTRPAKQLDPNATYAGGYIYEQRTDIPVQVSDTNILQNDLNSNDDLIDVPYLIRVSTQERIIITGNNFSIGRDYDMNYRIPENISISKHHCSFVSTNGTWYVMDNKSSNKTYVDGKLIEPKQYVPLHDTSEIILANEKFIFRFIHNKANQDRIPASTFGIEDTSVLRPDPDGTDVLRQPEDEIEQKAYILIEGKRIFLEDFPFTIGRSEKDSYKINGDRKISRKHLIFTKEGIIYYVKDNSTNGTKMNGEVMDPKKEYRVKNGDKFDILGTELEFNLR